MSQVVNTNPVRRPTIASRVELPVGWVQARTVEGLIYYWNKDQHTTQWEFPRAQGNAGKTDVTK
jgi:hypothetical protein